MVLSFKVNRLKCPKNTGELKALPFYCTQMKMPYNQT